MGAAGLCAGFGFYIKAGYPCKQNLKVINATLFAHICLQAFALCGGINDIKIQQQNWLEALSLYY